MNHTRLFLACLVLLAAACGEDTNGGGSLTAGATGNLGGGGADGGNASGGQTGDTTAGFTAGANGGSAGSGTSSVISSGGDGGEECERVYVQANRAAPDMLIVMDASGSMAGFNQTFTNRWDPAVSAVNAVVSSLESAFKFGLSTYPAMAVGCSTGQIDVPIAAMNAQPIANFLGGIMPTAGNTPTAATLAVARDYLAQQPPTLAGEFALPQYVMLVTDGDPNCVDVQNPISGLGGVDMGAQQASRDEVAALAANNVLTYVIGYDTQSSSFAPLLDELAVLGNTGDTQHRSVTSGDELITEFQRITEGLVSCSFVLAQEADFAKVKVYLDGEDTAYDQDWTLRDDGHTVDLIGAACDRLRAGAALEAEVVCEDVNLI